MRHDEAQLQTGMATPRSIVVLGEDPLMVRALDRLLRTAGYSVGTDLRSTDDLRGRAIPVRRSDIDLTIVDLPDDRASSEESDGRLADSDATIHGQVLWISNESSAEGESDGCLVKPFTSIQLLDKVRKLLGRQSPL
jgi:hypothetical protein